MTPRCEVTPEELQKALVHNECSARHWGCSDPDELVSAGLDGIAEALKRFDPSKGRFVTYASFWIKARQRVALKRMCSPVSIPMNCQEHFGKASMDALATVAAPEVSEEQEERFEALHRAIDLLPEDQRKLIVATYFEGTTRTPQKRALRSLRAIYEGKAIRTIGREIEAVRALCRAVPAITAAQIASKLGLKQRRVYQIIKAGNLPVMKREGCKGGSAHIIQHIRTHGPKTEKELRLSVGCSRSLCYKMVEQGYLKWDERGLLAIKND